jgi:hypothetical protein
MPIRGVRYMGRFGCQPDESQKAFLTREQMGANGIADSCFSSDLSSK